MRSLSALTIAMLIAGFSGPAAAAGTSAAGIGPVEILENKCSDRCRNLPTTIKQMQCQAACKGK